MTQDSKKADVEVITIPYIIRIECPHCEEELGIKYRDFCDMVGEPADWVFSSLDCPECDKSIEIERVDWL